MLAVYILWVLLALTHRHAFGSGSEVGAVRKCGRAALAGQPQSPEAASAHLLPAAVGPAQAPRSPRPRLRLPVCCPPPSFPSWRRALFARSYRCASAARRRRRREGAALPSPAAAAARLLPAAVGDAQAPRSPCPRLRLPVCCPSPSPPRWRGAPFARSCHCASPVRRRRRRAGAALPTPAAASFRLLPPAFAPALAPRCRRPRLPLRA